MTAEPTRDSPGMAIADRLWEQKAASGVAMTKAQVANVIDAMLKELGYSKKRTRVGGRDLLFDALCVACGINPQEVTRMAATGIGTALADIAAVTPDLTPEEFGMRAAKYRREHPDWELTPTALCTHWGELGKGDAGQTVASMHASEPQGWQDVARRMFTEAEWDSLSIDVLLRTGWGAMSLTHRKAIQNRLTKSNYERQNISRDPSGDDSNA